MTASTQDTKVVLLDKPLSGVAPPKDAPALRLRHVRMRLDDETATGRLRPIARMPSLRPPHSD